MCTVIFIYIQMEIYFWCLTAVNNCHLYNKANTGGPLKCSHCGAPSVSLIPYTHSQKLRLPLALRHFELSMLMLTYQTALRHKDYYPSASLLDDHRHYTDKTDTSIRCVGHHFRKGSDSSHFFLMHSLRGRWRDGVVEGQGADEPAGMPDMPALWNVSIQIMHANNLSLSLSRFLGLTHMCSPDCLYLREREERPTGGHGR